MHFTAIFVLFHFIFIRSVRPQLSNSAFLVIFTKLPTLILVNCLIKSNLIDAIEPSIDIDLSSFQSDRKRFLIVCGNISFPQS